eukprot:TRINITY_DN14327_c0_g1_i1.p1 TRINITY_DN14327_c0_g1~~TRINITY_DN14327_c0_g1_i1.p1  ORF type:complete len:725 (+),score=122.48 TRINITY_DN14327_c0_g1_i1:46-2220(+)
MEAERTKLESLLEDGFILPDEYENRKEALLEEFSSSGTSSSETLIPLDVGFHLFDSAAEDSFPLQFGHDLRLVCRSWALLSTRNIPFMCRMALSIIQNRCNLKSNNKDRFYKIKFIIENRIVNWLFAVMDLLNEKDHLPVMSKIMSAMAYICCYAPRGHDTLSQALLEQGVGRKCNQYCTSKEERIRKNALWTLSNFVINSKCLQSFLAEKNSIARLVSVLGERPLPSARSLRSACWSLANILACEPNARALILFDPNLMRTLRDFGVAASDVGLNHAPYDLWHQVMSQYFRALNNLVSDRKLKISESLQEQRRIASECGLIQDVCFHGYMWADAPRECPDLRSSASFALGFMSDICADFPELGCEILNNDEVYGGIRTMADTTLETFYSERFEKNFLSDEEGPQFEEARDYYTSSLLCVWRYLSIGFRLFDLPNGLEGVSLKAAKRLLRIVSDICFASKDGISMLAGLTLPGIEQMSTGVSQMPLNGSAFVALAALDENFASDPELWLQLVDIQKGHTIMDKLAMLALLCVDSENESDYRDAILQNSLIALAALERSKNNEIASATEMVTRKKYDPDGVPVTVEMLPQYEDIWEELDPVNVFYKKSSGFELVNGEEDSESEDDDEAAPPGRPVDPRAAKAVENGVCTFSQTAEHHCPQYWYECKTCELVKGDGICVVCAAKCHEGHELSLLKHAMQFFCDCGSARSMDCKSLPMRAPTPPLQF